MSGFLADYALKPVKAVEEYIRHPARFVGLPKDNLSGRAGRTHVINGLPLDVERLLAFFQA